MESAIQTRMMRRTGRGLGKATGTFTAAMDAAARRHNAEAERRPLAVRSSAWFADYLRPLRFFHRAFAPASACSPMSGLPGVISGASTRRSRDNASRIASLGVVPCFSQ